MAQRYRKYRDPDARTRASDELIVVEIASDETVGVRGILEGPCRARWDADATATVRSVLSCSDSRGTRQVVGGYANEELGTCEGVPNPRLGLSFSSPSLPPLERASDRIVPRCAWAWTIAVGAPMLMYRVLCQR